MSNTQQEIEFQRRGGPIAKVRDYVERGPWEEHLAKAEDVLDAFCWIVIGVAAFFFGPALWHIVTR